MKFLKCATSQLRGKKWRVLNINDRYGHAAGDKVLTQVATVAKKEMRSFDILGRYGGDEFLIGLVGTRLEDAIIVAKRISTFIANEETAIKGFSPVKITVSIGVKCLENEIALDELIDNANKKI